MFDQKYEAYRKRFFSHFMFGTDPKERGAFIPCHMRISTGLTTGTAKWGDTTERLSFYIAAMATEMILLKKRGLNYVDTRIKLKNGLDAFDRLDCTAESYYRGSSAQSDLNGFFIREDIPVDMVERYPEIKESDGFVKINKVTALEFDGNPYDKEMSQDQVWHLTLGFRLARMAAIECSDSELANQIELAVNRVSTYMYRCKWVIKNPVDGMKVMRGADARLFSYGFSKAMGKITGWSRMTPPVIGSKAFYKSLVWVCENVLYGWASFMWPDLPVKDYSYHVLMCVGDLWEGVTKRMVNVWKNKKKYPHLMLANCLMNGVATEKVKEFDEEIADLLSTAPIDGPRSNLLDPNVPRDWCCANRLTADAYQLDRKSEYKATYNGLDFMLLRNLYELVYN